MIFKLISVNNYSHATPTYWWVLLFLAPVRLGVSSDEYHHIKLEYCANGTSINNSKYY